MDPFVAQLADLCRSHPTASKWVIVPSHALGHTLGDRLALEGTSWLNLRFKTPFDLALEMAGPSLAARGIDPTADDSGPALMMRLLRELPDEVPAYFRHLALHPQMGAALWSTVRELRLAGLTSNDLPEDAFTNPDKHAELVALLAAYESHLAAGKQADAATVYTEALEHLDLTPVRPADPVLRMPNVIWAPLVQQLLDGLPGDRVDPHVARIPELPTPRRLVGSSSIEQESAAPLGWLMAPHEAPRSADVHARIDLFRAGGCEAEIEEVFRRVFHGCHGGRPGRADEGDLPLDSVEIACASPDYVPLIWEKAQRHDWPVTFAPGLPVTVSRPARALLAWCEWIENGFPASGLRRMFQSGDVRLDIDDGPRPGRAARLLLMSEATWGRATYESRLTALAASDRSRAGDPENDDAERDRLERRAAEADRLRTWITALLQAVPDPPDDQPIPLQAIVEAASAFVSTFATIRGEIDAKAVPAVDVAVGELRTLGAVSRPIRECLGLVRAALDGVSVASDRARPGHLHVTRLATSGHAGRPHSFIVGLEEGRVLPVPVEDAVLLDAERERIHQSLARSNDRVEEALHAVVSRMASLPGNVTLSYSSRDLREFRDTYPSWLMLQARRLQAARATGQYVGIELQLDPPPADAGGTTPITYEQLIKDLGEPASVVPADPDHALSETSWWLSTVKNAGQSAQEQLLDTYPALRQGQFAEAERASDRFTEYDGHVPAAAARLDPRQSGRAVSATGLETLAKCPFSYFLKYGLRLEPQEDDERDPDVWLDAMTRGLELHALYAKAMRQLRDLKKKNPATDPTSLRDWLQAEATSRLDELRVELPPPSGVVFERERDQMLRDLDLFLDYELKYGSGREPVAFEVAFGGFRGADEGDELERLGQDQPIDIELDDVRFKLNGRIDRIDRVGEGRYEVIDYKTGGYWRSTYAGTFRGGRLLQHALYGLAAAELLRRDEAGATVERGTYYFPAQKGGGQRRPIAHPARQTIATVVRDLLDVAGQGAFLSTHEKDDCRFCRFDAVCDSVNRSDPGDDNRAPVPRGRADTKLAGVDAGLNPELKPIARVRKHE